MRIALGTKDGVFEVREDGVEQLALPGRRVTHLARREDGAILAVLPRDGAYLDGKRVFEGDARSCAFGPDGSLWVGVEPAMVFRSGGDGARFERCDAIDALPTRSEWSFPLPPHAPHVLSIDFVPGTDGVLVGVEVGGALFSPDGGSQWRELRGGIYEDVHSIRPDSNAPGALYAVTGRGFYASEDAGASFERRMEGVRSGYTIGLSVNPARAREILLSATEGPGGERGRLYHTLDAGRTWVELEGAPLPHEARHASVPFFAAGAAWVATDAGALLRADDPRKRWELVHELGCPVHTAHPEGTASPSSVMH